MHFVGNTVLQHTSMPHPCCNHQPCYEGTSHCEHLQKLKDASLHLALELQDILRRFEVEMYFKWTIHPKVKNMFFLFLFFTCSAVYPSRLFWCDLPSSGDTCCKGVCLPSDIYMIFGSCCSMCCKNPFENCLFLEIGYSR